MKKIIGIFFVSLLLLVSLSINKMDNGKNNVVTLTNIEALASEISVSFCMYTNDICEIYDNGFAIKGYLQYSGTV